MESQLATEIRASRKRKRRVSPRWLRARALSLLEEPSMREGEMAERWKEFTASRTWARKFMQRKNFTMRKKSNAKRYSVVERIPLLSAWHRRFRHKLQTGVQQCPLYGEFDREHRFREKQPL